jgi:hypothetical protein
MAYAFLYFICSLLWYKSIKLSHDKKYWYTLDLALLFLLSYDHSIFRRFGFFRHGAALFVGTQIHISPGRLLTIAN